MSDRDTPLGIIAGGIAGTLLAVGLAVGGWILPVESVRIAMSPPIHDDAGEWILVHDDPQPIGDQLDVRAFGGSWSATEKQRRNLQRDRLLEDFPWRYSPDTCACARYCTEGTYCVWRKGQVTCELNWPGSHGQDAHGRWDVWHYYEPGDDVLARCGHRWRQMPDRIIIWNGDAGQWEDMPLPDPKPNPFLKPEEGKWLQEL